MKTWDSVKVIDKTLESFGRVGTVRSAGLHDGPPDRHGRPERHGDSVQVIDVLLDGDTVEIEFRADQVAPV